MAQLLQQPVAEQQKMLETNSIVNRLIKCTNLMDSENQLAMNLGETYLVTENGNERLGKQKLDLVVL